MPDCKCAECGKPYTPTKKRYARRFCGVACHTIWKNRRSIRGSLIYDFLMTQRYDRANEEAARSILQNLCRSFRESDKNLREGRPSWRPFAEAKLYAPLAHGTAGDGR